MSGLLALCHEEAKALSSKQSIHSYRSESTGLTRVVHLIFSQKSSPFTPRYDIIKTMIDKNLYPFFWDIDPTHLDIRKYKDYIIERLLELGDEKAVQWLFINYSEKEIRKVLHNSRSLSAKSRRFWEIILG